MKLFDNNAEMQRILNENWILISFISVLSQTILDFIKNLKSFISNRKLSNEQKNDLYNLALELCNPEYDEKTLEEIKDYLCTYSLEEKRYFKILGWCYYLSQKSNLKDEGVGKWMHFYDKKEQLIAEKICKKAIEENICYECKCTDTDITNTPQGVICFYCNGDNKKEHKKIIKFMIENNLIRKTKTGKFYNISFKRDSQTSNNEYGANYSSDIKLEQFINLDTGKWV